MTLFNYINQNIDRIKHDVKIGITSYSVLNQWAIYSRYDYWKKLKNSTSNSVILIENEFQISSDYVYKIIKKMETEI